MSRARDLASSGVTSTVLSEKAPLASPDFTGTVDLTGTTVNFDDDEISLDKLAHSGTIGGGTFNGTIGSSADLDTVLPFSSSAFSNDTPVYFNVGQIRIALGFTTTGSSASASVYNDYAVASWIQVTGYAHAPRVFIEVATNYEETSFSGLISDITLVSGNTYKFKPWMSTSSRGPAVESRQMHFMVIGAKA